MGVTQSSRGAENRKPNRRERLQVIFVFLIFFGGMMFVVSPDPNRAQATFRIAIVAAGLIGLAWLNLRRPR